MLIRYGNFVWDKQRAKEKIKQLNNSHLLKVVTAILLFAISFNIVILYSHLNPLENLSERIKTAFIKEKKNELRSLIKLAQTSIKELYKPDADENAKQEARDKLRQLKYKADGYFFVYDYTKGPDEIISVVHPFEGWEGDNKSELRDCNDKPIIKDLLEIALKNKDEGGFYRYMFPKPSDITDQNSNHKNLCQGEKSKLGHVIALENWKWYIGTGLYTDDFDIFSNKIDKLKTQIQSAFLWISIALSLSIVLLYLVLVRLQKMMTINNVADDLHEEVMQEIGAIVKQAKERIEEINDQDKTLSIKSEKEFTEKIKESAELSLGWLRNFRDKKEQLSLAHLPLIEGLNEVIEHFRKKKNMSIQFDPSEITIKRLKKLSTVKKETLIRVTREALTNVYKHASATKVVMELKLDNNNVILIIADDGIGMEFKYLKRISGLEEIERRLKAVGGERKLYSSPDGTIITAIIPLNNKFWSYLLCLMKR